MQQETAQELFGGQGHLPLLISVGIVLPTEGDLIVLESEQAVVGDDHTMGGQNAFFPASLAPSARTDSSCLLSRQAGDVSMQGCSVG